LRLWSGGASTDAPSGKFAYVTNRLDNSVSIFSIDHTTGNLSSLNTITTGMEPYRVTFDPSGKFVYVANEASGVAVYNFGPGGSLLSASQTVPGPDSAVAVVSTPNH